MALIDRGRVMADYLENLGRKDSYKAKYEALSKAVDEAPAVDAVPVVRCKDCKHRGSPYSCPMRKLVMPFSGPGAFEDCTEDDGYCHKGERKDGGAEG